VEVRALLKLDVERVVIMFVLEMEQQVLNVQLLDRAETVEEEVFVSAAEAVRMNVKTVVVLHVVKIVKQIMLLNYIRNYYLG
jgi:hypothetical protein